MCCCSQVLHGPDPHLYMATDFVSSVPELTRPSPSMSPAAKHTQSYSELATGEGHRLKGTSDTDSVNSLIELLRVAHPSAI